MQLYPDILMQSDRWQQKLPDARALVERVCGTVMAQSRAGEGMPGEMEVSIVLADDAFIKTLNATYRGKDTATNVLSFPTLNLKPGQALPEDAIREVTLGDIIIALETVEREAIEEDKPFEVHVVHMLVHGMLHLLGYDHVTDMEAAMMEPLEISILHELGVGNPY